MTRRRGNERGIALLVTLLILVLVVALAHEVFRIGAQSAQTGAYGRDSIRCILLAEGGTGAARISRTSSRMASRQAGNCAIYTGW